MSEERGAALQECFDLAHDLVLKFTGKAMKSFTKDESRMYDQMADGAKAVEMAIQELIRKKAEPSSS